MEFQEYAQREVCALVDRLASDAAERTRAEIDEREHQHESAMTSIRLRLEEQARQLAASTEARVQLTTAVQEAQSRLDALRTEFGLQQAALEAQRGEADTHRRLAAERAPATEELAEARADLDAAHGEVERLTRQFDTALEELRVEHVNTLHEQALARTILPLDELLTVFTALASATTPSAVLGAVVSGLAREFSRVALFRMRNSRLECVSHVGFEFEGDIAKVVIPASVDSLMTRAASSRHIQSFVNGSSDEPCGAPFGGTPACSVALPLVSGDATVAVVYADDADQLDFGSVPAPLLVKFAQVVWHHAIVVLQQSSATQKTLSVAPAQRFDRLA